MTGKSGFAYFDEQQFVLVDLLEDVISEETLSGNEGSLLHDLETFSFGQEILDDVDVVQLLLVLLCLQAAKVVCSCALTAVGRTSTSRLN